MSSFTTPKGTVLPFLNLRGKDYLQVAHRLVWFREEHPDWEIFTEAVSITETSSLFRAFIKDPSGRVIATAHKREDKAHFQDHTEKAETGAVGRALAYCGYGTQFAPELEEGERVVDAPLPKSDPKSDPKPDPKPKKELPATKTLSQVHADALLKRLDASKTSVDDVLKGLGVTKLTELTYDQAMKIADRIKQDEALAKTKPLARVTEAQITRLYTIATNHKWTRERVHEFIGSEYGLTSTKELNKEQYDVVCNHIMNGKVLS